VRTGGRVGAIVVGAGGGRRLGGVEKAFLPLCGRPLLAYSVEVFEACEEIDDVCLVVSEASVLRARELVRERGWQKVAAVVAGGAERQESVRAGFDALDYACDWILVHDAARPLVTRDIIQRGLAAARAHRAAVAAIPVRDTLKRVRRHGDSLLVWETVDRSDLWAAQTPQVFRHSVIRQAFQLAGSRAGRFTDDASLVEAMGWPVAVFEGSFENVKVTFPEDVPVVEALLRLRGVAP
jgi:2-C-methyl-D-erythritol 4-phosphate cytidylyltransferase